MPSVLSRPLYRRSCGWSEIGSSAADLHGSGPPMAAVAGTGSGGARKQFELVVNLNTARALRLKEQVPPPHDRDEQGILASTEFQPFGQ